MEKENVYLIVVYDDVLAVNPKESNSLIFMR